MSNARYQLLDLLGPGAVSSSRRCADFLRPSTVAVEDHTDVLGDLVRREGVCEAAFVSAIEQVSQTHALPSSTLCQAGGIPRSSRKSLPRTAASLPPLSMFPGDARGSPDSVTRK